MMTNMKKTAVLSIALLMCAPAYSNVKSTTRTAKSSAKVVVQAQEKVVTPVVETVVAPVEPKATEVVAQAPVAAQEAAPEVAAPVQAVENKIEEMVAQAPVAAQEAAPEVAAPVVVAEENKPAEAAQVTTLAQVTEQAPVAQTLAELTTTPAAQTTDAKEEVKVVSDKEAKSLVAKMLAMAKNAPSKALNFIKDLYNSIVTQINAFRGLPTEQACTAKRSIAPELVAAELLANKKFDDKQEKELVTLAELVKKAQWEAQDVKQASELVEKVTPGMLNVIVNKIVNLATLGYYAQENDAQKAVLLAAKHRINHVNLNISKDAKAKLDDINNTKQKEAETLQQLTKDAGLLNAREKALNATTVQVCLLTAKPAAAQETLKEVAAK